MPSYTRRSLSTTTKEGEITINLNLSLTLENGNLTVASQPIIVEEVPVLAKDIRSNDIIPTELFEAGDDLISGFGEEV